MVLKSAFCIELLDSKVFLPKTLGLDSLHQEPNESSDD